MGKLERLQKLKESGAITDSEFQREKAKILAEQ
ncbi:MAG: SHOCT domain-containing protein [Solirubrobacterales bacterium]